MQSFPYISSQLLPPLINNLLRRERLVEAGLTIRSRRITTVVAPTGYGKSVWVSSLTQEPEWPLTAWLSLDENDSEVSCFFYHLIHAVKMVVPGFGSEALRTINSIDNINRDWTIAAAAFLEDLPSENLVLVVDDFHLVIKNEIIRKLTTYLIRWLPADKHLVIISRFDLPLNLSRYRINNEILEIKSADLLFTEDETDRFLKLLDLKLEELELSVLHRITEGWAVCLRLLGTLLQQTGAPVEKIYMDLKSQNSALYEYLGHELLAFLPKNLRGFLVESSLLPYLEAKLCNAALGGKNSADKIGALHNAGLLSRVEGDTTTWRLHHLIKEYLMGEIEKSTPPDQVIRVRQRASIFLEKIGEIDQAVEQAVALKDWPRVSSLIRRHGYDYYTQTGRLDGLYAWVDKIPDNVVEEDHWLLFFKGRSILQINNEEALSLLIASAEKSFQKEDLLCEAYCLLAMSYAQVQTGNMQQGELIMQRLMTNPLLMKDPVSYGAALSVALGNAIFKDNVYQGLQLSRIALRLKLNPELRMTILYGSAIIQHRLGNLAKACLLMDEALNMPFVQGNERWMVTGCLVLSTVQNLMGDSRTVKGTCQKGLYLTQKYRMVSDEGRFHRNLARMYLRDMCFSEAHQEYEKAITNFVESDSTSYAIHTSIELAMVRLQTGENARELLLETRNLMAQLEDNPIGQGGDQNARAIVGILAIESGEIDYAQELYESLVDSHRQSGQNPAGTYLVLSYIYLLQGKERAVDKLLVQALSIAEDLQLLYFWEWHDIVVYTMCRRAVYKNIHARWALRILTRWFPEQIRAELGFLLISKKESLRSFAQGHLQYLFRENQKTFIHLFYFKKFRVFVNGQEVPETDWKTKKAETLLKLLAYDRSHHLKDVIVEQLWPGSKSGDANLRMALSQVRKVLGKYGAPTDSVLLQRKCVFLNPEIKIYTDFGVFYRYAHQAFNEPDTTHPRVVLNLEQALNLYSGPFLSEDLYESWTENKRVQLRELYLRILKRAAECYFNQNINNKAINACTTYLEVEPADETIIRMAMQLLTKAGQRQKALSLYRSLEKALNNDYGTVPEKETRDMYGLIRKQD